MPNMQKFMPHWPKPTTLLENEGAVERTLKILERLDNPHKKLPKTIHVAGTNGKGSTIAFLRTMLEAAGNKVHSYTTPHLVEFNERINLSGENISDNYLFEVLEEVRINTEGLQFGFYEATTAAAFLAFSRIPADYLLLETGLGGRLDATNVIENPVITILTTISKDHTEVLGDDVREIAFQKLHIVKKNSVCISSLQHDVVYPLIHAWCEKFGIEYIAFGFDYGIEPTENGFRFLSEAHNLDLPMPSLVGDHQTVNAATAVAAALQLGLSPENISQGVANAYWPSRLEKIERPYVPQGWEFWLDGAHNPAGAFAIANHLEYWKDKPTYLIFGTTKGRDISQFLDKFVGKVECLAVVKINAEPRSYEAADMLPKALELGFSVTPQDSIQDAIKYITKNFSAGRILACGSLFMRGDI